ncbi:galactoside alpha-(1,2)-fucosyltransferase 2-like [Protopterus annectens]|uniref:galactoside alpha-(1,2)-fucosyltransferase 2-like n=1 Tax=Protopterus annectens TaxID=7888 RepID=UPI001CFA174A|nr:galactoside alpha-(1,2)-fucosyltransferase 2-like [Protopterus annectens]
MWICMPLGRLGNLMGQYAVLYALSKLNGHKAFLVPRMHKNLSPVFNLSLPVLDQQTVNSTPWRNYILHDWMSDKYKHIKGDYIRLVGYTTSWTFYHHIRNEILQEFTFHDFINKEANYFLWEISKGRSSVTFVGVHVRRGDYVSIMANIWKGVVGDQAYFQKAMDFFRKKYRDAVFVVATNGFDWCKKNIDTSKGDVYFTADGRNTTAALDLAILAKCNHTIMSVGTFGYWAAYLAGGETVYLSNFTRSDSRLLRRFKYEAAFLPKWIGIPADISPLLKN